MRIDKNQAFLLRQGGKSYKEIGKKLGVPKSTLSGWFRNETWSEKIKKDLIRKSGKASAIRIIKLNKIRGEKLTKLYKQAQREAKREFHRLKHLSLFIAGLSIYWGEGDNKSKHQVRLSNTDPNMIKIFIDFLIKICKIEKRKIKAWILIYPDLSQEKCLNFWREKTGLEVINFNKTIIIKGKHKTNRLSHGVCYITVSSRYFKEKMFEWIKLLPVYLKRVT